MRRPAKPISVGSSHTVTSKFFAGLQHNLIPRSLVRHKERSPASPAQTYGLLVRMWAFTVLGLKLMRLAIALLLKPPSRYCNASRSRRVRLNCLETCDNGANPAGPRSSSTATHWRERIIEMGIHEECSGKIRLLPDRHSQKGDSSRACRLTKLDRIFAPRRASQCVRFASLSG